MILSKRIKSRREELGLSQEELATMLGYKSRSSINKIELGKSDITQHKIAAFAKALQTTPAYLMGWTDNEETEKKNDAISDIILNLRSDSEFLKITTIINKMPKEQYGAINAFLTVLQEQDIN